MKYSKNYKFEYEQTLRDDFRPWAGHKYFAYDLIEYLKPEIVVELGTHYGTSFFSFCQSVKDHHLKTKLYAVDSWEGEKHSGHYDGSVYELVKSMKENHYSELSIHLLKMYFNEALKLFDEKSIDLLHIDGLHTYEAVKEDFESWLPKMKSNGIVLFHDISIINDPKRADFGVNKLWNELKKQYITFDFYHSYGLGVLILDAKIHENFINQSENYKYFYTVVADDKYRAYYSKTRKQLTSLEAEHLSSKKQLKRIKKSLWWRLGALMNPGYK
jgi:predicted O-methyltransferase YrrM